MAGFQLDALEANLNFSILQQYEKLSSSFAQALGSGETPLASINPADTVISETLRSQIAGLNQRIENISMVILKYDTADAYVGQLRSTLSEIRALSISAANTATLDEASAAAIQGEVDHLVESYNFVLENANFNGASLLDGGERSVVSIQKLQEIDFSTAASIETSVQRLDTAIESVDAARGEIGASIKHDLRSSQSSLEVSAQNLLSARVGKTPDMMIALVEFIRSMRQISVLGALKAHSNLNRAQIYDLLQPPTSS